MQMTQEELANVLHVSKSAVAKWETDGGIPDRDNLKKLAREMRVSVDELHRIIDKFHDTIDKFIYWICKKFDMGAEDNLIRDFERENHTLLDAEKQVKKK